MLKDLLDKNKAEIAKRWANLIFDTYPGDSHNFFKTQSNRFANPVGSAINESVEKLFQGLVHGVDSVPEDACMLLDNIVRIRAVQEFSPANAVGFVFLLKKVVRETLANEIFRNQLVGEILEFESRVDNLALLAFDIYTQCRQKIFDIRATELRNRTSRILDRACQKYGMPHEWELP